MLSLWLLLLLLLFLCAGDVIVRVSIRSLWYSSSRSTRFFFLVVLFSVQVLFGRKGCVEQ